MSSLVQKGNGIPPIDLHNVGRAKTLLGRWSLLISYSLLILLTLSIVRNLRDFLNEHLGRMQLH